MDPNSLLPTSKASGCSSSYLTTSDSLGRACFQFRDRKFWRLQKERLDELGCSIYDLRFARAIIAKLLDLTLHPKTTTEKAIRRVKRGRDRV